MRENGEFEFSLEEQENPKKALIRLKELADDDVPEGKHFVKLSAKLFYKIMKILWGDL